MAIGLTGNCPPGMLCGVAIGHTCPNNLQCPTGPGGGSGDCGSQGAAGSNQCSPNGDCGPGCQYGANSGLPGQGGTPGPSNTTCEDACVAGDTRVALFDGGCKCAAEIEVGDRLLGFRGSEETVSKTYRGYEDTLELITEAGILVCSRLHVLLDPEEKEIPAGQLRLGDHILTAVGQPAEVRSIRSLGVTRVFGWTTQPSHIYQAGSFLNHNERKYEPEFYVTAQ